MNRGHRMTWSALAASSLLSLTLVVLVVYAYDTNSVARITRDRWAREGVLGATYNMPLTGERGDGRRTMFQIHNPSTLVIRAKVACNFRIYDEPVKAGPAYDGDEFWLVFPKEDIQGWFEVEQLLQMKGKSVPIMMAKFTPTNRTHQLTMKLELEFWDELGSHRTLPAQHRYFDLQRWAWIPHITEGRQIGSAS
jgi:hypothetical protein